MSLQLPYLGGPASLGCLYDARTDQYITGPKLWSPETMETMTSSRPAVSQTMNIQSESSFAKKASSLEIGISLKLSFLSGMINVDGAGRYLSDTKTSINSEMLTFECCIRTEFRELNLGSSIDNQKFLDDGAATHVVTGIHFGARAFLVFERELRDSEDKSEVSGELQGVVSKFKALFEAPEKLEAEFDSQELDKLAKIKCRYYGEFKLEPPPLSLKEAIGCIKSFSSENAKSPITVYLTPLSQLAGKPQVLINKINDEYLNEAGDYCQMLSDVINAAENRLKLLENTPWHVQRDQLQQFLRLVETHKTRFTQKLASILPGIRETGGSGDELSQILTNFRDRSPFDSQRLETWMKNKERECRALQLFGDSLTSSGAKMLSDLSELDKFGMEDGKRILIEFLLPESVFLQKCTAFCNGDTTAAGEDPEATWIEKEEYISTKSELSVLLRFLKRNRTLQPAFNCSVQTQHSSSIMLQVKQLKSHKWVPVEIPVPPTGFQCARSGPRDAVFTWENSEGNLYFKVTAFKSGKKQAKNYQSEWTKSDQVELLGLDPGTEYEARVVAAADFGESEPSKSVNFSTGPPLSSEYVKKSHENVKVVSSQEVKSNSGDKLKDELLLSSRKLNDQEPVEYELQMDQTACDEKNQVRKMEFGRKDPTSAVVEKVIMIVGETGSGKTTLINSMVNYILGVNFEDKFRFRIITDPKEKSLQKSQSKSQTQWVTSYTFHHREGCQQPFTLTLVDTPGFGDTGGIVNDKKIVDRIREFFSSPAGIDHLDAVGFVAQSGVARLTPTQRYVFDSILSLFGKDIGDNIFVMITFADANVPPVLESLKEAGIVYKSHTKFNNSAVFAKSHEMDSMSQMFNKMFWDLGMHSFKEFFSQLNKTETKSLTLTKDVLTERQRLQTHLIAIKDEINLGISALNRLESEISVIKNHQKDLDRNKDFTYTVVEEIAVREAIPAGQYITNCLSCNRTCHYPCFIPDDNDKADCAAMTNGKCDECPGRCVWSVHKNMQYRFIFVQQTVTKTSEELKNRYTDAQGKLLTASQLAEKVYGEYLQTKAKVMHLVSESKKCLKRLHEIALKPDPLSEVDYIDKLIDAENMNKREGYPERIQQLRDIRELAIRAENLKKDELMQVLLQNETRVYQKYKDFFQKPKVSLFSQAASWFKS
ncbi:hypothetical protein BOX15_Mlig029040g1 [Macrostomum lignano]|uniref:Fibronectin type-III domain-containing protein n=2 Tax=Macrostomum lignano TaxID=282301 RepID=A0A1I8J1Q2_9PLAT|nr:hypothetical protein BOX15_Mlig029040g1 [Macrostomum lignano]